MLLEHAFTLYPTTSSEDASCVVMFPHPDLCLAATLLRIACSIDRIEERLFLVEIRTVDRVVEPDEPPTAATSPTNFERVHRFLPSPELLRHQNLSRIRRMVLKIDLHFLSLIPRVLYRSPHILDRGFNVGVPAANLSVEFDLPASIVPEAPHLKGHAAHCLPSSRT